MKKIPNRGAGIDHEPGPPMSGMQRRGFLRLSLSMGAALAAADVLNLRAQPALPERPVAGKGIAPSGKPLFFLPERIAAFQQRINPDQTTGARWQKMRQSADDLVAGKASGPRGSGFDRKSRLLGLAWKVTGDERYAKKLRDLLHQEISAANWMGQDVPGRTPQWHSYLGTAASVVGCAAGREALENYLPPAERQQITEGMMRLGVLPLLTDWVLPEQRIHALDSMGHNWWSVCVSGCGVGILAILGEDPHAAGWLEYVETALAGFFDYQGMVLLNKPANFDPAGAFYESVGYANYALESYLMFRLARTNAVAGPPAEIPVLERMAGFFVQTSYPANSGDLAINFGDSALTENAGAMWLLAALGYSPALTRWYLNRPKREVMDPLALLYLDTTEDGGAPALPESVLYPVIGWAALRDTWKDDGTLLGAKCGFTWNHAHADAGSFVLFQAGQPLLIDSGHCNYQRPEYLDYYCQSKAHNVVLFDGEGQPMEDFHERGVKFPGHLHDLVDDHGVKYLYADATGPMAPHCTRNYRHWLWVDGVILVFDDILARKKGRLDWLLHYAGTADPHGATVQIKNEAAAAEVRMLYPPNVEIHEEKGFAPETPDKTLSYLRFSVKAMAASQKFITAIVPRTAGPSPTTELLSGPNLVGARIGTANQITDVYLNLQSDGRRMHVNSNNVIDGWETDAYLLAISRPASAASDIKAVSRYFVCGCSYLRRAGQTVLDSFSKVTGVFKPDDDLRITMHGQPQFQVDLFNGREPKTVQLNGQPTAFSYLSERRTIRVRS